MKLFKKAKKGFTLVELVVVIAVIAILAAVSVGAYFGVTESANNSQATQEAKALHTSIRLIVNDPAYPDTKIDEDYNLVYVEAKLETDLIEVTGIEYDVIGEKTAETISTPTIFIGDEADSIEYYTAKGYGVTITLKTGELSTVYKYAKA